MKNTYHRAHGNARTFLRLRDKEEACTPITGGLQTVDYRKTTSALLSDQAPKITPRGPWRTLSRHSSWHSAEGRPTRNARRHLRGPNATNDLITRKKSRHNPAKPGYILDALLSFSGAAGRNPRRRPRICRLERISLPVCKGSRTGRQETPRRSPRRRLDGPRSRGCLA